MKKLVALIAVLMLAMTVSTAFAATLDLSYPLNKPDVYTVEPSEDGSVVFIETVLTASDRHFTHKYESDYYWSSTQFDVLGLGYGEDYGYPVWRVWVIFANDIGYQNINSVTFVVQGTSYTFTDISDPDWQNKLNNSYLEECLIKFGMDNLEFVVALEQYVNSLEDVDDFTATLILHGDEDIEVTLGGAFALDFALTKQCYLEMNGLDTISEVTATPMTIK